MVVPESEGPADAAVRRLLRSAGWQGSGPFGATFSRVAKDLGDGEPRTTRTLDQRWGGSTPPGTGTQAVRKPQNRPEDYVSVPCSWALSVEKQTELRVSFEGIMHVPSQLRFDFSRGKKTQDKRNSSSLQTPCSAHTPT